ncbi:uncharacterized protein LOC113927410 [Zalophus californianus]|uniref:Uncharacterized protein LOC113927410 n=1 Tax=Zalophus californianus TaxID=9704 RepID=A0A6J2DRC8_ZALCA|nr:uncharacterized protein LOC113927410 [Zalophus californianus]
MCNRSQIWSSWLPPPQLKDPTWGWGGTLWRAAGRAARSTASARRGGRPAGALNPWLRAARARRPPGRRRVARGWLGNGGRGVRLRPEGTLLPGLGKGRGAETMRSGNLLWVLKSPAPALEEDPRTPFAADSGSLI